jgi:hypothetical protein
MSDMINSTRAVLVSAAVVAAALAVPILTILAVV